MKRSLCIFLAILLLFGTTSMVVFAAEDAEIEAASVGSVPFHDVNRGDWFYSAVRHVYQSGIMVGTSPTTFSPAASLSRAEVTAVIFRLIYGAGISLPPVTPNFEDVFPGSGTYWARGYINWATDQEIMRGVGGNRFAPNDLLSREHLAATMHRVAVRSGSNVSVPASATAPPGTSNWAQEYMRWATHNGFLDRDSPRSPASRAETAMFLYLFYFRYYGDAAPPQPTPSPRPTSFPQPTPSPRPTSSPQPTPSPRPTSSPQPTPSPRPTSSPQPTPVFGINLSVSGTHTFPEEIVGYTQRTALMVFVSNTGNWPTGVLNVTLSGQNADAFVVGRTIESIGVGAVSVFSVMPSGGLRIGTYTATVTVSNADVSPRQFHVTFRVTSSPSDASAFEREVLDLVNAERSARGLSPLQWHAGLASVARNHSRDMESRSFFSHTCPSGITVGDRIRNADIPFGWAAENIARGQRTPAVVMNGWMNSAGHREHILNPRVTHLGVGFYNYHWTQNFIG